MISYISYPTASLKAVKFAASVLLLYTALTPVLGFAAKITSSDAEGFLSGIDIEQIKTDDEYLKVAETAFRNGIFKLLESEFSVGKENAEVLVFDFDFKNMKAGKIKILLFGNGAVADFRRIEKYITESGLGECEVNVRIG